MNQKQRQRLNEALGMIHEAKEIVSNVAMEEQDKFDNLSEGLQQTEANQKIEEGANALQEIESYLEDAENELIEVINP